MSVNFTVENREEALQAIKFLMSTWDVDARELLSEPEQKQLQEVREYASQMEEVGLW